MVTVVNVAITEKAKTQILRQCGVCVAVGEAGDFLAELGKMAIYKRLGLKPIRIKAICKTLRWILILSKHLYISITS